MRSTRIFQFPLRSFTSLWVHIGMYSAMPIRVPITMDFRMHSRIYLWKQEDDVKLGRNERDLPNNIYNVCYSRLLP